MPPLKPPSPLPATTRWQGTITGIGFEPMIWPTTLAGSAAVPSRSSRATPARRASAP